VNCVAATRDFKWVFTGGDDGFIRKFDMYQSYNGESMLTGSQRQGLVDTIQRGGVLISAWENEDQPLKPDVVLHNETITSENQEFPKTSPVYSIDVHSEAVWCVTGTETGNINLYTVRHCEGKVSCISSVNSCPSRSQ
jgi:transcriptional activator SPT8